MDIFFEQLVKIKRTPLKTALMLLSIVAAAALAVACFWLSEYYYALIFGVVAVVYGEWKLLGTFQKEYEYIITNGAIDIDCIIAKQNRKRIISFEATDILRIGKYNPAHPPVTDAGEKLILGNTDDAYFLLVKKPSKKYLVVASLDARMLDAIKNSLPRNVVSTLFSEI